MDAINVFHWLVHLFYQFKKTKWSHNFSHAVCASLKTKPTEIDLKEVKLAKKLDFLKFSDIFDFYEYVSELLN